MVSRTQWTWVCVNSWSWWWIGSLACYSPWGHKESDMTERLNWTEYVSWMMAQVQIQLPSFQVTNHYVNNSHTSWSVSSHHISLKGTSDTQFTHRQQSCLPLSNKPMWDVLQKWILSSRNWPMKMKLHQRKRSVSTGSISQIGHWWKYRRNSWRWNYWNFFFKSLEIHI